jgi:hypothetical protein
VNAEFVIENQSGQCCKPSTAFTDFTPEVTMTGSAFSSKTGKYSQTISSDSLVVLLTDFTNTSSHIKVSLGKTNQTYFNMSQFVQVSGKAQNGGPNLKCGSPAGCYNQSIAVGPNANGSNIGDAWIISTAKGSSGDDYLVYRWENSKWVEQTGIQGLLIAVSPQGVPWVVDHLGKIHYFDGSAWVVAPGDGCATSIGVGPNAFGSTYGDPWIIGCDGGYFKNGSVYQLQGSKWVKQPGSGGQIAVSPDLGFPWVLKDDSSINIWNGSGFSKYTTSCASSIAVGPVSAGILFGDAIGDAWITDCTSQGTGSAVRQLQFGAWAKVPGIGIQIAVSPDLGVPWIVNSQGHIFK